MEPLQESAHDVYDRERQNRQQTEEYIADGILTLDVVYKGRFMNACDGNDREAYHQSNGFHPSDHLAQEQISKSSRYNRYGVLVQLYIPDWQFRGQIRQSQPSRHRECLSHAYQENGSIVLKQRLHWLIIHSSADRLTDRDLNNA